ncbi:hypothetical protein PpBr36_02443 [Pyricularia pennisetigena]|uniref:hypothetical protein n=1 Tax=Pyricularia pennisetigena TaxID=1578925 RepID=UPI0011516DC6|nr:hypothetical protein PpBr36_02443 [Pyricularia pennisetigena]TLS30389.1 hypothetical protein PpBr36_02443 [Pyricularia pennisetigena]
MFPFRSRGARLLSPSVQSLLRKAVSPIAPVRTARSRLYSSLQNHPRSDEVEKSEALSESASNLEPGENGKKPAIPLPRGDERQLHEVMQSIREWCVEMGYNPTDLRQYSNVQDAIDAKIALGPYFQRFLHCLRDCPIDRDLALQVLRNKIGKPNNQSGKEIEIQLNKTLTDKLIRNLLRRIARDGLVTPTEVMQLREELNIAPGAHGIAGIGGKLMPDIVHGELRQAWEWLLLKLAANSKNKEWPKAGTSPDICRHGPSPDASNDEVQRLTKALGVLKGAMGADKDVATAAATANSKNSAVVMDSSKAATPNQPLTKPTEDGGSITKKAPVSPLQPSKTLTRSEAAAFKDLQGTGGKDGHSDTPRQRTVVNKKKGKSYSIHYVKANDLVLKPIKKPQPPVPGVEYGLDRVLFNPGVYHLQCPRTKVYNFDPYLAKIMPIEEFDFSALKRYVTSSKDQTLIQMASSLGKKYTGSTSSMTASLAHFHYLISGWRPITTKSLTRETPVESNNFTRIMRGPAAAFLHYKDGAYAIDADKEFDKSTILSLLGKSMEKLLTLPKEEFEKYHRDRSHLLSESAREDPEAYHYTTLGDFLMRSQLDAHNPRLPGTGMYDLKTRAVLSIRMDATNIKTGLGYEIRRRFGEFESFEREYLDMIRSAFLKYSMQVRMGRMDGIFVAYHNTQRIFGFQYIPLEEMDYTIHGTTDRKLGDDEFKLSVTLLNKVLDKATARFPGKSLRLHFETRQSETPFMYIFAKPVSKAEIDEVQEANRIAVEKFEKEMLGLDPVPEPASEDEDRVAQDLDLVNEDEEDVSSLESPAEMGQEMWADMMDRVEDAMEDDARGIATVREAIERALEESGLLANLSPENSKVQVDALLSAITNPDLRAAAESIQTVATMEEGVISPDASGIESEPGILPDSKNTAINSAAVKETAGFSLKDMVLGLAARAQTSTTAADLSERDLDNYVTPRETLRIRKFERILSEMLSGSQEASGDNDAPTDIEAKMKQADSISNAKSSQSSNADSDDKDGGELLGMVLTARNMLGSQMVERVNGSPRNWSLAYSIEEMDKKNAEKIYQQVKDRRRETFEPTPPSEDEPNIRQREFLEKLRKISQSGMRYRKEQNKLDRKKPVYVLGQKEGLDYREVFGETPSGQDKDGVYGAGEKTEEVEREAEEDDSRGFVDRP